MKVSAQWLSEYTGIFDAKKQADYLEQIGVEIEQIVYTSKLDKKVIIADVKKVVQHPDADRLKVVELSLGKAKTTVVCGASNVLEGQKVALVQPGVTLDSGITIEKATIRGIESAGMIASAHELGLGDDKSGIMVLEKSSPTGKPLSEIWPEDAILDVKTAANRPDLLSVIGLAREIAAAAEVKLKEPVRVKLAEKGSSPKVKVEKPSKTRRYMALELSADPSTSSPDWMQRRLIASGVRPKNAIVDVTNYVMLEYGQPLHSFDAEKVKGNIIVRHAASGEKLVTLDGQERKLTTEDVVISDSSGPIALAGIMGGAGSEISDKTKKIILECASFDAPSIRRSAIRHGTRTEASARFERNLPVQLAPIALSRAAELLQKHAKAKIIGSVTDELTVWPWIQHIGLRASKLEQMAGYKMTRTEISEILRRLDIDAEPFDIVAEAKKHLGKPYVWGASYKKNGTDAFDCGYLIDYLYSLIGVWVGHTAPAQLETGRPVHTGELQPGDILFYTGLKTSNKGEYSLSEIQSGKQPSSTVGYYFKRDPQTGEYKKMPTEYKGLVGHDGIYIGDNKVLDARHYIMKAGEWIELPEKDRKVQIVSLKTYTDNPGYIGARRHIEDHNDFVRATAPWWRPDLKDEADLMEEVIRIAGYHKVPSKLPAWQPTKAEFDSSWSNVWKAKDALKSLGMYEVMTYSFISEHDLTNFGFELGKHLKLRNPMSREQGYLRSSMLPSLVIAASKNTANAKEFGMFELSKVFKAQGKGKLPNEPATFAAVFYGPNAYRGVKAALDALASQFNLNASISSKKHSQFHPARYGEISFGKKVSGFIGEVHPSILSKYRIKGQLAYIEVDASELFGAAKPNKYQPISRFPSVLRDLAVIVKQDVTWQEVHSCIDEGLAQSEFLSDFSGQDIPTGKKSLAFRLTMTHPDKTLTDAEADERLSKILAKLKSKYLAELRA